MAKPSDRSKQSAKSNGEKKAGKDSELTAFGRRLCKLRKQADMTQESLAHAAGLHWTYVGQVERGERNLSYKNVLKLARGLGLDAAELLPKSAGD